MYVYQQAEPNLYTVGFYTPDGKWMPESDHGTKGEAVRQTHFLNGVDSILALELSAMFLREINLKIGYVHAAHALSIVEDAISRLRDGRAEGHVTELLNGCADMLMEAAKQLRLTNCSGHAEMCELHARKAYAFGGKENQ